MQPSTQIWLEVAHHQAFRAGGWAFVRRTAGEVSGTAGGERRIDLERTSLAAMAAALHDLAPGGSVTLHTASPHLLAIPSRLAAAETGENPPAENLDLWAQLAAAFRSLDVRLSRAERAPGSGSAFAAAWAELARDRAKDKGAFTSAIPKVNLAKAGV